MLEKWRMKRVINGLIKNQELQLQVNDNLWESINNFIKMNNDTQKMIKLLQDKVNSLPN